MATFIPPTYKGKILQGRRRYNPWRFMNWRDVGYNVLITGGTVSTYPGVVGVEADDIAAADSGSGENGKAWFRGGIAYTITGTESTTLSAAGYSSEIT